MLPSRKNFRLLFFALLVIQVFLVSPCFLPNANACSLTVNTAGGGSVTADVVGGGGGGAPDPDPALRVEIGSGNSYVILENSEIRAKYEPYFADFDQFAIREFYIKSAADEEQVGVGTHHYLDADAGRGTLSSASIIYDGLDRKTVRLIWNDKDDPNKKIIHEVSIFPNGKFLKIDYIDVQNGLNIVDNGEPGGSISGTHVAYGAAGWPRDYITHNEPEYHGSYYNRYAPDGVNDPVDGGSLNYNGHFILGVYNAANGRGFARVVPVPDSDIIKLIHIPTQRRGLEFFPHAFNQPHAPFTSYLYAVTGGENEVLTLGQELADGVHNGSGFQCGDEVELTATAYSGWDFDGWSGDLLGSQNPAYITLSGDHEVTADFTINGATYYEDFEGFSAGADPVDWLDTGADSSLLEDDSLFEVFDLSGNKVYGTSSTQSNIHSHYVAAGADAYYDYEYTGRMMMTDAAGGIGVTFLSQYPQSDAYYRLRRYSGTAFHINPHGTATTGGVIDTGVVPAVNIWYRFRIQVEDTGTRTEIRAKVWQDGTEEPAGWQVDAYDDSATRLTSGTVGLWSHNTGGKYWDDLLVASTSAPPAGPFTLTVTTAGSGTVAVNPDQVEYDYGDQVTLTATAASGWVFTGWSGGLSGSTNPATVTMIGDRVVTANFAELTQHTLTVTTVGSGTVSIDPNQATYDYGDQVTLIATPGTDWYFSHWSGDLSGSANPATLTITADRAVTVNFTESYIAYSEDFEGSAAGADPVAWLDTGADSSLVEDDSLFKVFDLNGNLVFGTTSTEANIHSHYVALGAATYFDYQFSGRMMITDSVGGIGVTFLSQYPQSDAYYRLRRYIDTSFHITSHGTAITGGTTDTGVVPLPNVWYRFKIEVEDTGTRTEIRAKVWQDGADEPTAWQVDAYDDSATRLGAGSMGLWSFNTGGKYWDDLEIRWLPTGGGDPTPPTIDVWYGSQQVFGNAAVPQRWVNILGNVSDPDGVTVLTYSLNGGPELPLSIGPDDRRLEETGDFNIEIDYADLDLVDGVPDVVSIRATDRFRNASVETVTINYDSENIPPMSLSIDWSSVPDLQNVVQAVDGKWTLESDSIRNVQLGYDRNVAIGDILWSDYEVTVPITIHDIDPIAFDRPYSTGPGLGIMLRWQGHYDWDGSQPRWGYDPFGGNAWYEWFENGGSELDMGGEGWRIPDPAGRVLEFEMPYIWKMRVQTTPSGVSLYSFKLWEQGQPEPKEWQMSGQEEGDLPNGSFLLLAHHVDASFGDVTIVPTDSSDIPVISNVSVTRTGTEAIINWTTNVPATSRVDYGLTDAYELGSLEDATLKTEHSITLTGLTPGLVYHYLITAVNGEGFVSRYIRQTFFTDTSGIASDDFESLDLDEAVWTFIDDVGDATLTLTGEKAEIFVPAGSTHTMWTNVKTAPRLMQSANDVDFELEAKFDSPVLEQYQFQGILIDQDLGTFLRLEFINTGTGTKIFAASIAGDNATVHVNDSILDGTPLYLRVKRQGDQWTLSYSNDGENWTVATNFTLPITVTAVGVYTGNEPPTEGSPAPAHTAVIDYFFNTASRVHPNDPPVAEDQSLTLLENTQVEITLSYSDPDGPGPYTFPIVQQPTHGTLSDGSSGGSVIYTPDSDYIGLDSFIWRVHDGADNSGVATVQIKVGDESPVAADANVSTPGNTPIEITLSYSDPDGPGPYTFSIVQQPTNGALSASGSVDSVLYTPDLDYNGLDSFTWVVNDGFYDSNLATVNIAIGNQAPVAEEQIVVTPADTAVEITLLYSDSDGPGPYGFTIVQLPTQGTLADGSSDDSVLYVPTDPGFTGVDSFSWKVSDGFQESSEVTVMIIVENAAANDPPVIISDPVPTAIEGALYSYQVVALDPEVSDVLTYSLLGAPAGMSIDPATGLIQWTPENFHVGVRAAIVLVTDSGGLLDTQGFAVTVEASQAPQITSAPITAAIEGDLYSLDVEATDANTADVLTFSLDDAPAGMSIDPATGLIQWTPGSDQVADYAVVVRVTDTSALFDTQSFTVTVYPATDRAPQITSTPVTTATQGLLYSYDVEAIDPETGDVLTYSLLEAPAGMNIDSATGLIQWMPGIDQAGNYPVVVRVTDSGGLFVTQSFTITAHANRAPQITSAAVTAAVVDVLYSYDVEATDLDAADVLTFRLDAAPAGMNIDPATGLIQWTPGSNQPGDHAVVVRATDVGGLFDTQSFTITVDPVANLAPWITSAPVTTAIEGVLYTYDVEAEDLNLGDVLTYSLIGAPVGMSIDPVTGLIQWTPNGFDIGVRAAIVQVTDAGGLNDTQSFAITVEQGVNLAPQIDSVPVTTAIEDTPYTYDVEATDLNTADVLTFSLDAAPAGMSIDAGTGLIQWTPGSLDVGTRAVIVRVTDPGGLFDTQSFTITVDPSVNTSPVVSITAPADGSSFTEGDLITFSGTADDTEDGDLSANLSWSSDLDGDLGSGDSLSTAALSVGSHTISASVTDSGGLSGLDSITVTVNPVGNTVPVVSITAPADGSSFDQGSSITFSGTADDDEDGDLSANLSWSSDLDGDLGSGGSLSTGTLSVGTHIISASVTDSGAVSTSDSITVTINLVGGTVLFSDQFGRADGDTVGNGWSEIETIGAAEVAILNGKLYFIETSDAFNRPMAKHLFSMVNSGKLVWEFDFDWTRTDSENGYRVFIQLGDSSLMTDDDEQPFTQYDGVGVNLVWTKIDGTHQRLGYRKDGVVTSITELSGPHHVTVEVDLDVFTYAVAINGSVLQSDIPFDQLVDIDTVRFFADALNHRNFSGRSFDNVVIRTPDSDPPVNEPPVVSITAPADGLSVTEGTSITFSGSANDTEDGDLSSILSWSSDLDGIIGSAGSFSIDTLSVGTHTITATVTDTGGLSGSAGITVTVEVVPNTAPVVSITAPADGLSVTEGTSITFSGSANDTEDGDLSSILSWSSDLDGIIGSAGSFSIDTLSVGTHTITATVTDTGGLSGSAGITVTVEVVPNTAPVVSITAPADGLSVTEGTSITFSGSANDTEDGDLSSILSWSSDLDGIIGSAGSFSIDTLSVGTHTITATVTDTGGLSGSAGITVTVNPVGNTIPTVTIAAPADGLSVTEGTSITFSGSANDTEDGDLSSILSWSSDLDGIIGSAGSFSIDTLSVGTHTITATVTDTGGLSGSAGITVTVEVVPNTAPVVSITAPADGLSVTEGTSITFSGSANDTEDGDLSSILSWSSDLDGIIGSAGSFSIDTLSVGTHTITATVTDTGGLSGSAGITVTVNPVGNTIPTVTIAAPADGLSVTEGTSITFSGSANDTEDGDLSSILSWSSDLDGIIGSAGSFSIDTLSVGTHTITATVTDTGGLSGSAGITVTVEASGPSVLFSDPFDRADSDTVDNGWGEFEQSGAAVGILSGKLYFRDASDIANRPMVTHLFAEASSGKLVWEFDFDWARTGSEGTYRLFMQMGDSSLMTSSSQDNGVAVNLIWTKIDGVHETLGYRESGVVTSLTELSGAHHVTVEVDLDLSTYEVAIDGSVVLSDIALDNAVALDTVRFFTDALNEQNFGGRAFDNVEVKMLSGNPPGNQAPVVTVTSPADGSAFTDGNLASFSATADDNEDGDISASLSWSSDLDGVIGSGDSFSTSILSLGTHTITASVTDSGGLADADSIIVTVTPVPNTGPVATITSPADGSALTEGNLVSFSATADDNEDGDISASLSWSSDLDGVIGSGASFSTTTLSVGIHTITASVMDSGGLADADSIIVTVNPVGNTIPVVTITSPADGSAFTDGNLVSFSATADDNEDGDISASLSWSSDLDGVIGSGDSFSTSILSLGTHTITASVTDSGGLGDADSIIVTVTPVPNTAPVVTITSPPYGSVVNEGTSVSFSATADDNEDGDISASLSWSSDLDGVIGSGGFFSTSGLSVGTHSITASVTDSGGLADADFVTITVDPAGQTILFSDGFDRADSDTVNNGWGEFEQSGAAVEILSGKLHFSDASDIANRPMVTHLFAEASSGKLVWEFDFDWDRTGSEGTYRLFMQLGDSGQMTVDNQDGGIGVNLIWTRIDGVHQSLGYRQSGVVTSLTQLSGPHHVKVIVDLDLSTYEVAIDGSVVQSDLSLDNAVNLNTVRFFTDALNEKNFSGQSFDQVEIKTLD